MWCENFQNFDIFVFHTLLPPLLFFLQIDSCSSLKCASHEIIPELLTTVLSDSGDIMANLLKIEPSELNTVPGVTSQPECRHISLSSSEHCNCWIEMNVTHLTTPASSKYNFDVLRELNLAANFMSLSPYLIWNSKESSLLSNISCCVI